MVSKQSVIGAGAQDAVLEGMEGYHQQVYPDLSSLLQGDIRMFSLPSSLSLFCSVSWLCGKAIGYKHSSFFTNQNV